MNCAYAYAQLSSTKLLDRITGSAARADIAIPKMPLVAKQLSSCLFCVCVHLASQPVASLTETVSKQVTTELLLMDGKTCRGGWCFGVEF